MHIGICQLPEAVPRRFRVRARGLCACLLAFALGCGSSIGDPPDRAGLVFVRAIGRSTEVMWARLSDGQERPLTATPEHNERWPYWSDAANRLVYQREPLAGGNSDLVLWDPGTGESVPLRSSAGRDERWPVWSPDGQRLVYAFRGSDRIPAGIASEKPDGTGLQLLAMSGPRQFFFRPSFSPDGSRLIAQRRGPDGGSSLWILAAGRPPVALTDDPAFFDMKPRFSRAGDTIVYSRRPVDREQRDVAIIDLATRTVRVVASLPEADDHSGRPSPTRDEIAFSSNRSGSYEIFLTDYAGANTRAITTWPDRDALAPRWAPNGEHLVLSVNPAGEARNVSNSRVVVIDRTGRIEIEISGAMADWMPAW